MRMKLLFLLGYQINDSINEINAQRLIIIVGIKKWNRKIIFYKN